MNQVEIAESQNRSLNLLLKIANREIYYSGQPSVHGWNPGSLCLATLPLDRWAGYVPKDAAKPAIVKTKPLPLDRMSPVHRQAE